jgi:hypothetical protein
MDEYKKVGITSGVVGTRSKPKKCISAGYTRVGLITNNTKETSKYSSNDNKVAYYDFPLVVSENHTSATWAYPRCTTKVVTHCYQHFYKDKPFTVRTRSITLVGMTHLDPMVNNYSMKMAKNPDTSFKTSEGERVWRLLQREFFINRYEAYKMSMFLFEQRMNILIKNEKGRCIPGFPCMQYAMEILKSLMVAINNGGEMLDTTNNDNKKG